MKTAARKTASCNPGPALVAGSFPPANTMQKPFDAPSLYLLNNPTDIAVRDGQAVCEIESIDRDNDTKRSRLWLFSMNGAPPRPLTRGTALDSRPRSWSPDGRQIAFL